MVGVCLNVQTCISWPSHDLTGRIGHKLNDFYALQNALTTIFLPAHTYTQLWGVAKGFRSIDHTLETLKVPRVWRKIFCMKIESFFLEKNQVLHLPFPSLSFHWKRFCKHIPHPQLHTCEWVNENGNLRSHNLNPILIGGDSIRTSMEGLW